LYGTTTDYVITVETFTADFVISFTAGSKVSGAPWGDKSVVLNVFTTDSAYDLAMKTAVLSTTRSYTKSVVKTFSTVGL
jgi:hypothetical protein